MCSSKVWRSNNGETAWLFGLFWSCERKHPLHFAHRDLPFLQGLFVDPLLQNIAMPQQLSQQKCACCCQALILNASLMQRPTSAGKKPKHLLSLTLLLFLLLFLFIVPILVVCPVRFNCFWIILHRQWLRIRGEPERGADKTYYWMKILSIHLRGILRPPWRMTLTITEKRWMLLK